jgi:tRNA-2-methylthio-N6-dimethylallyladenosine synthase
MNEVKYDMAFMFKYSERPKTLAERKFEDDVPEDVKGRRLQEVIDIQMKNAAVRTKLYVGYPQKVLIEGTSKKSEDFYQGRNTQNVVVVFPKKEGVKPGEYVTVLTTDCTSVTLIGEIVG